MASQFIPLVDLDPWFNGSQRERANLASTVDAHLKRCGFLVVINHGIAPEVFGDLRAACCEFFHLPVEQKAASIGPDDAYRGWVGAGKESNAATYGVDTPPDLKETFAFGPVSLRDETMRTVYPTWYAPNVWPEEPASFRPAAERFWLASNELADELLELFSIALGLPSNAIPDQCRDTTASGTLNWYWPHDRGAPEEGQFRIGPHTDFGTLTILDRQPGVGGLQVRNDDGEWVDAPVLEGSLIVNTGDMLRRWTNDRWCSNEHRVLPPSADAPEEELISLVFFHEPDADTVIAPFSTCVTPEQPARYEPILSMDYLTEKFAALKVND